jgi:hypothetical protein
MATTGGKLSEQQIAQGWVNQGGNPKYADLMAKIALRESGGRPGINNRGTNSNGTVDWGLFQVNDIWRHDPVVGPLFRSGAILTQQGATKAAIHILKVQGPKAWATYNPATDQKYLGAFNGGSQPASPSPGPAPSTSTRTVTTPGVDNSALRRQYLSDFLQQGGVRNSGATLAFASGIQGAQDTPGSSTVHDDAARGRGPRVRCRAGRRARRPACRSRAHQRGRPAPDRRARRLPGARLLRPRGLRRRRPRHRQGGPPLRPRPDAQGPFEGPHGPLGWSVYIQGADGRTYYLTHMGSRNVKVGQTVRQGQQIGTVANYAKYGTPSHIHMGVNG